MQTKTVLRLRSTKYKGGAIIALLCIFLIFCLQTIIINNDFNNTLSQNSAFDGAIRSDFGIFKSAVPNSIQTSYVHIGGTPIGIAIATDGLIVSGIGGVYTERGEVYPTLESDIRVGDIITEVDGVKVSSIYQFKTLTEDKERVTLRVKRNGMTFNSVIMTALDSISGKHRLGIELKEDIGGVGTLTFVTDNRKFAALGHYISDIETGLDDELDRGNIYAAEVEGVIKGQAGKAGGLLAEVNRLSKPIGSIRSNTQIGLYGDYSGKIDSELYRIALKGEAKMGAAQVYTTIEGSIPQFYDIDIVKVVSQTEPGEKGMVIAVRDKRLLNKTGGIVQGMSGSPIVQNGMLIGAVTHVFIQDPTRGYAVHSRFMYDFAEGYSQQREAA